MFLPNVKTVVGSLLFLSTLFSGQSVNASTCAVWAEAYNIDYDDTEHFSFEEVTGKTEDKAADVSNCLAQMIEMNGVSFDKAVYNKPYTVKEVFMDFKGTSIKVSASATPRGVLVRKVVSASKSSTDKVTEEKSMIDVLTYVDAKMNVRSKAHYNAFTKRWVTNAQATFEK